MPRRNVFTHRRQHHRHPPNARGNTNELAPEHARRKWASDDWLDGRMSTTLALYQLELYNRRTTI